MAWAADVQPCSESVERSSVLFIRHGSVKGRLMILATAVQGTPGLMYGPAVDLWSAGVVLFILLGGYPPFYDESEPALFAQIRKGQFTFDDPVWDSVSDR